MLDDLEVGFMGSVYQILQLDARKTVQPVIA